MDLGDIRIRRRVREQCLGFLHERYVLLAGGELHLVTLRPRKAHRAVFDPRWRGSG